MTHIGENISIVTFNGQLICVPEKLSGCYKESEHVENDEFITNDVSELLSDTSFVINSSFSTCSDSL
jgi:hypothetical protein